MGKLMIGRVVSETGENVGFHILNEEFKRKYFTNKALIEELKSGKLKVDNIEFNGKEIVSTNGAMSRYTAFNTKSELVATPAIVILRRIEKAGVLVGYMYFNTKGEIKKDSVGRVVAEARAYGVANGKIVTDDIDGNVKKQYISSIRGNYEIIEYAAQKNKEESPKGNVTVNVVYFGGCLSGQSCVKYAGILVDSDDIRFLNMFNGLTSNMNKELMATVSTLGCEYESLKYVRLGITQYFVVIPMKALVTLQEKYGFKIEPIEEKYTAALTVEKESELVEISAEITKGGISNIKGNNEDKLLDKVFAGYIKDIQELIAK